ncbi:MAG: protein TolA, partial [Planctomycetota bacterium]
AKTEAEIKRIEQQSADEIKNILAATEKKVDAELTKLKAHIDQQVAGIAKRLEADRAAAVEKPAAADADADAKADAAD